MPVGYPSFLRLVELVTEDLGLAANTPGRRLLERVKESISSSDADAAPPLDQLMAMLQRTYGVPQVEASVARHLRLKNAATTAYHSSVLQLSSDDRGHPRVVTTNFDRMFEKAQKGIRYLEPPIFPSLKDDEPFTGLVYLHGRLGPSSQYPSRTRGLILGSPDFGRAYLADGRTLSFLTQLLSRYVVVFLGYNADDPPIRYLLVLHESVGLSLELTELNGCWPFDRSIFLCRDRYASCQLKVSRASRKAKRSRWRATAPLSASS